MPLITFEGIDRCGKTSVIRALLDELHDIGAMRMSDFSLRETEHLKWLAIRETCVPAQVHLFTAARIVTHRLYVQRVLEAKGVLLYDRYIDSTLAYQGQSFPGTKPADVYIVRRFILQEHQNNLLPLPDLTFVLDIPVAVMRARMVAAGSALDAIESKPDAYFEEARQIFLQEADFSKRHVVVDATKPIDAVVRECLPWIQDLVGISTTEVGGAAIHEPTTSSKEKSSC